VSPPIDGRLVLVAEDNGVNQLVTVRMLERHGCRADVVANGRAAVEAIGRVAYDLVLMDCEMPEMDGFEATRAIRAGEKEGARRLPIVAITAKTLRGDRERCLAAGMDDYLPKPVTTEALDAVLARWLGAQPNPAPPAPSIPVLDPDTLVELQDPGIPGLLAELIGLFSEDAPHNVARLHAAVAGADPAEVTRIAHALKGSAATLGARTMAATCAAIEAAGRAGRAADLGPALAELQRQTHDVLAALAELAPAAVDGDGETAEREGAKRPER
jgi:CheY-like chemotaxis protein